MDIRYVISEYNFEAGRWDEIYSHWSKDWVAARVKYYRLFNRTVRFKKQTIK